ncbi:MAG: M56 family metallopeptidase [Oscillospiraceae bacterium]|nr:M56 family metallopeptidase [Oscillospiraceae bacterium]
MTEGLTIILSLSLSGSAVISLIWLLEKLVRGRAGRRWGYYIWLIAVLRLLLPLAPAGSPAGELAVRAERTAVQAIAAPASGETGADQTPEGTGGPARREPEEPSRLRELGTAALENLWLIWLAGALVLAVRKATAYQGFVRYVRAGWTAAEDPALLDLAAEAGAMAGVKRPVEVYVNPLLATPMLLGTLRPRVVLPTAALGKEDLKYVLLHELIHCRRGDILYKWLVQLAVCVHWFNPLVHWMSREIERTGELACDEAALLRLDEAGRRAYGDALLRAMEAGGGYKADLSAATLGKNGRLLKERLDAIMNFKKITRSAAALSLALAALVGLTAVAAGAYTGMPAPEGTAVLSGKAAGNGEDETQRYTMECYYEMPYMFGIGWNLQRGDWREDGTSSAFITLPEGGKLEVYFNKAAGDVMRDEKAIAALTKVLARLAKETRDTDLPLKRPLVYRWEKTGGSAPAELAEKYYEAGNLPFFKTVFARLSEPEQTAWMERICEDDDIVFFSLAVDGLEADGGIVKTFAEQAYADGDFAKFSVLADRMPAEMLGAWLDRAVKDEKLAFQSILLGRLEAREDWDNDDWDWEDWKDKNDAELERRQAAEYAPYGVTKEGKSYYYKGELVDVFLDQRPDKAFYTLDMNPEGTVNIKIIRNEAGEITGTAELTQVEIEDLFEDDYREIPVELDAVKAGEYVWLGTYELDEGDQVYYSVSAEKGDRLAVGFAKPGDKKPQTTYLTVSNRRTDGEMAVRTGSMTWKDPVKPGEYSLFIHAPGEKLEDVVGWVKIRRG